MERRGIKGEKKRREREVCRELRKRKKRGKKEGEERKFCECKSFITKREISDFGLGNKLGD